MSPTPAWSALAAIATQRFSSLGLIAVTTLLVTGLINAWFLVGSVPALIETPYGQLLSTKVALLAAIVSIAAVNRLKLRPRLPAGGDWHEAAQAALQRLRRNVIAEILLGAVILVIAGTLGTMRPPFHTHGPAVEHHRVI